MKRRNFSIRQLRALLVMGEERNFTRAARRFHLSQSAMSSLVRSVEEELDVRLFERNKHNVEITATGRLFLEKALRIVTLFDQEIEDFDRKTVVMHGLTVAAMPSFATYLLPVLIRDYQNQVPSFKIDIIDVFNAPCIDAVQSCRADFGITSLGEGGKELIFECIAEDPFRVVCRSDHPLAGLERISGEDLAQYPFIHYSPETRVRHQIDAVFPRLQKVMEIERLETIRALVESGAGISVAPASTLPSFRSDYLVFKPLQGEALSRSIYIVRKNVPMLEAHAAFLGVLRLGMQGFMRRVTTYLNHTSLDATLSPIKNARSEAVVIEP